MVAVAGIHFGNTNSVITVSNETKLDTVSNETGDRVTPTIVAYTGTEKVIGQPAKQFIIRNPLSCISNIKASVGSCFTDEEIKQMKEHFSCEILTHNGKIVYKVKVENDTIKVKSGDAASYVFTKLLEIAENVGGADLEDVVLTVPVKFSEEQRILLSDAAESIGCNVLRLINEPAAALLAYGIGQEDSTVECNVLVFRLGGSSMDATIMNVNSGMYSLVGQKSKEGFGGKDFDEAVVKYLIQEFKRKTKADISDNKRAVGKLKAALEECKHGLTKMTSNNFNVDSLYDGLDFNTQLIRAKFESICKGLFVECVNLADDVLKANNLTEKQIDKVVFAGGGTRMPLLIDMFKKKFQSSQIMNSINPEEVLSVGAALQASLLQGREGTDTDTAICSLDCVAKDIGVKVLENNNERLEVVLSKNTPVPTRKTKTFSGLDNQLSVRLSVFESDSGSLEGSRCLAVLVLKGLPEGQPKEFSLTLEVNRTGTLVATLVEKNSGKTEHVNLQIGS